MMNPGVSANRIPAKVSLADLASVTAGFANEVDDVNQYAAVMYAPTAKGVAAGRCREQLQMTVSSPRVAMNSARSCGTPARACKDAKKIGAPNIVLAAATP